MFGSDVDHAHAIMSASTHLEVAYLETRSLDEISAEIKRFNPHVVLCGPDLFLQVLQYTFAHTDVVLRKHLSLDDLPSLTHRELQVIELLARGRSNSEIGAALHLSSRTVKRTLSKLFERFHATNRIELAVRLNERSRITPE